jgi:hypothetical protein
MRRACSTHGSEEECLKTLWSESQKQRDQYEHLGLGERIILKSILEQ